MFDIQEELKKLPGKPGVYIMHDERDDIIYVGKAISLKNRVRQYFQSSRNKGVKIEQMVTHIVRFEYIVTDSELEALVLECNLIKEHRPKYNTMLMDDKSYPFIKVTVDEPFPRIMLARMMAKDKAKYFGPYTSAGAVKDTIELIRKLYSIRSCNRKLPKDIGKERPCLNYHIHQCKAPCQGYISQEDYRQSIHEVVHFLNGNYDIILKELISMDYDALMIYDIEKTTCEGSLARIIRSRKVDGFINLRSSLSDKELQLIDSYEAPCVSVFQRQHTLQPVSQYSADDYQAGYLAGEYFSHQNNYHPVFISIPLTRKSASNRYKGYCTALALQGIEPIAITDCDLSYKSAFHTVMTHKELFLQQPCAVFVYNDIMALGAVRAFIKLGLSVPEQVQLIGLDGIPMGSWASPTLSTLVAPVHDMVYDGCQTLKRMLDGEMLEIEHKLYLPALVHRETTLG